MFPKPLTALKKENFVVNPVSNSAISLCTSSTELTYPKLSACLPSRNGSRLKILAMLFLFVPQESWDLQLRMFGYITCGFPRIFGYVLQVIKYSISVPLDRGGFGGWNLMLTFKRSCVKVDVDAMTIIAQDDHLTAGAWVACGLSSFKKTQSFVNIDLR